MNKKNTKYSIKNLKCFSFKGNVNYVEMLWLIGRDGLINLGFANFQKIMLITCSFI